MLASTQRPGAHAGLRVAAASALRAFLQATAAQRGADGAQHRWALACVAAVAPYAAAHVHALLGPDASQQLKQSDVQARWWLSARAHSRLPSSRSKLDPTPDCLLTGHSASSVWQTSRPCAVAA